jgi:hypothetical protein
LSLFFFFLSFFLSFFQPARFQPSKPLLDIQKSAALGQRERSDTLTCEAWVSPPTGRSASGGTLTSQTDDNDQPDFGGSGAGSDADADASGGGGGSASLRPDTRPRKRMRQNDGAPSSAVVDTGTDEAWRQMRGVAKLGFSWEVRNTQSKRDVTPAVPN